MCVSSDGYTKCSPQSKICQFDGSLLVDEKVLRLQVSVEDTTRMTKHNALKYLVCVALKGDTRSKI